MFLKVNAVILELGGVDPGVEPFTKVELEMNEL